METNPLKAIMAHVRYELNIIMRSWFFRIFAIIVILILTIFGLTWFSTLVPTPWQFKGLASFTPYVLSKLLNVVQTALLVFLATDMMKRDKKLDSSEVILIRSMSNSAYIWGKALSLIAAFALLDLLILTISIPLQLTIGAGGFNFMTYIYYPLMILLPSTVFAIGFSFWLMRYVRSQAIVILVLLSLLGMSLFYFRDDAFAIFDLFAFFLPLTYSDFVGFTHLTQIIMQRLIYFSAGFAFIMWAGFSFERLRQSSLSHRLSLAAMILGFVLSAYSGLANYRHFSEGIDARARYKELNTQYAAGPFLDLDSCQITIEHAGNQIKGAAVLYLINNGLEAQENITLNLNPGLDIEEISADGQPLKFLREQHLIFVKTPNKIKKGERIELQVKYRGRIDENILFANIGEEQRAKSYQFFLIWSDKKHAFIEKNFLFLPKESLWYPSPGLPPGSLFPKSQKINFTKFRLSVKTGEGLTIMAPGKDKGRQNGYQTFVTEQRLPFISLLAGDYERKTISVDSIHFTLATLRDHDYYKTYFEQIGDTLKPMIHDLMLDYERTVELSYPYHKLELIEVPLQFYSYKRLWTFASARISPQQVFITEKGVTLEAADFPRRFRRQDRAASDFTLTDKEKQYNVLHRLFQETLLGGESGGRGFRPGPESDPNLYNIFPNYYSYVNFFRGKENDLLNSALESFLLARTMNEGSRFAFFRSGLTDEEKVSRALQGSKLSEIFADTSKTAIAPDILRVKGDYLMSGLQAQSDVEKFDQVTMDFINQNRFSANSNEQLIDLWKEKLGVDAAALIDQWMNQKELPGLLARTPDMYKVYDGDHLRYQVILQVANNSAVPALVRVSFRFGGRRQRLLGGDVYEEAPKIISLDGNTAKRVGMVLDEEPRGVNINYLLAQNIPLVQNKRFEKTEIRENIRPFEGELVLTEPFRLTMPGEIVVDNEDSGFSVLDTVRMGFLQRLLSSERNENEDFVRFQYWNPPSRWRKIKNSGFYGSVIHSARYIRGGIGEKRVQWQTGIKSPGNYDVYAYITNQKSLGTRRFKKEWLKEVEYTVYHDDGNEKVGIRVAESDEGWNLLGSYYFSEGTAKVILSDKSQSRFIVADAVKWVKK